MTQGEKTMDEIRIFDVNVKLAYGKFNETKNCTEYKILVDGIKPDDYKAIEDVFKEVGKKYIPNWFKEQSGEMFLKSRYDFGVLTSDETKIKFSQWVETGTTQNSKIRLKVVLKDGIIYPKAIKVIEDGEQLDLFSDM